MWVLCCSLQAGQTVPTAGCLGVLQFLRAPYVILKDGKGIRKMGTYLVTWLQQLLGQEVRNTFYYVTSVGEPSNSEWQDVVDEIRADLVIIGDPEWVDEWFWYGIDRRRVDVAGLLSFREVPTGGTFIGNTTTDSVATQVALLVSNKGTTTKPNRARSFLAGFSEAQMTDSIWNSAVRASMEELIDLQSNLNSGGTNPLSRVAAQWNSSHTQVIATNDLSGAVSVASLVPATQRRRRIGVGI